MDLADFLLVRIAEEESEYQREERNANPGPWDRLLVECGAKRRIVQRWQGTAPTRAAWGGICYSSADEQIIHEMMGDDVLPLLALSHAGHPDYREEWRP